MLTEEQEIKMSNKSMFTYKCINYDVESDIYLYPDYSSTGIWCKKCGVNLSKRSLMNMPNWLFSFAELWNDFCCDVFYERKNVNRYNLDRCETIGKELQKQISRYYRCHLHMPKYKESRHEEIY